MRTICQGTEHMAWAPNKKGSNWRQMQHHCNQFGLSFMRRTFYWCNDFDSDLTLVAVYSEKQVLDSDGPIESGSNEKTGAHIENRCRCAGAERSARTPTKKKKGGMTRKKQKNIVVWKRLIVLGPCVFDGDGRFSYWRWVWLTSSIRSVTEVWRAALPWYWDHRTQTAICCLALFFLITFES